MLYSELELLGESHPELMRTFNLQASGAPHLASPRLASPHLTPLHLTTSPHRARRPQMAKGALEEKLADTGMSVDDLERHVLERHINELLAMQASARWKSRHRELQALREGLYADLYAEKEARMANERIAERRGSDKGGGVGRALKGKMAAFFKK